MNQSVIFLVIWSFFVIGFLTNKWVVVVVVALWCLVAWDSFCREIMHAMWKLVKFKYVYVFAKCPSLAAQKWCSWSCCCSHANSSNNLKCFSANLTVDGYQGSEKRVFPFSVMRILTRKMLVIGLFVVCSSSQWDLLLHPFTFYKRSLLVSTLQKTSFFVQSAACLWFCLSGSLL